MDLHATSRDPRDAALSVDTPIRIGDLLLKAGYVTQEQIEQAVQQQRDSGHKKLLGEVLVDLELVSEEQVMEVLARAYGIPFARISPRLADPKTIDLLPREFLEKQNVLPLYHVAGKMTIAVPEPTNVFLIEEVQRLAGCPVQIVAATAKDISSTLQAYLPNANVFVIDEIVEDIVAEDLTLVEQEITDLGSLEEGASKSPVIKLVNYIIHTAVQEGASDIHIEPGEKLLRVRNRVDGRLFEKLRPPFQMQPAVVSRIKIMAGLDISERRVPQDGGITVLMNGRPIDLRVSTMPGKFGEKVVIRIIDNRSAMTSLEKLGFSFEMLQRFRTAINTPNGVVLVTGPTGSGKSTTLYSALNELNDEAVNICTVEDPVENNLGGINQFQVNDRAGFTFANALRALLRQDPDIIMVGEIRDQETARIATQAALTGHLVLSTLHTNDAPSAITRLFNIGVEPYLVAAAVRAVLAQRLLRKICTHCKESIEPPTAMRKTLIRMAGGSCDIDTVYQGVGCQKCRNTGYAGRIGVFEYFAPDDELADAISRGASLQELRHMANASGGFTTLGRDGFDKIKAGLTSVEELFKATAG